MFELGLNEWFGEDVGQVVIGVNLDHLDVAIANLIFEMMPFDSYVFGPWAELIGGRNDQATLVVFVNFG